MPNAQLSWSQAAWVGLALVTVALLLARASSSPLRRLAPFAREAGVIAFLYTLWQLVGTLSEHGTHGAFARARWIARVQAEWHFPSERSMQRPLLEHPWLGQAANVYYATMHFTALFAVLLWVFWRHRDAYVWVRAAVIGFTGLALVVQLIPVAPPRLLPGFTDVAVHYGQSVYAIGGVSVDELSAMPSVHVGWAVLIGAAVLWLGSGPLRWLGVLHAVITVWVVTATANHWWLDGVGAVALLAVVAAAELAWHRARSAAGSQGEPSSTEAVLDAPRFAQVKPTAGCG